MRAAKLKAGMYWLLNFHMRKESRIVLALRNIDWWRHTRGSFSARSHKGMNGCFRREQQNAMSNCYEFFLFRRRVGNKLNVFAPSTPLNTTEIIILYLCVYLEYPSPKLLRCCEHEADMVINKNILLHPCTSIPYRWFFPELLFRTFQKFWLGCFQIHA